MYRTDAADNAAVEPVPPATGTVGFYDNGPPGTIVDAIHLNAMQEEIATVVEQGGVTLDKADNNQLAPVVIGVHATDADLTDTGSSTTTMRRSVIASETSRSSGDKSLCAASQGSEANGLRTAAIASNNATIDAAAEDSVTLATSANCDLGANARRSAVIAAGGCDVGVGAVAFNSAALAALNCEIDANRAAVIASTGTTVGGDDIDIEGTVSAVIASSATAAAPVRVEAAASEVLIGACRDTTASGAGRNKAAIGCISATLSGAASGQLVAACGSDGVDDPDVSGNMSAAVACRGNVNPSGNIAAAIACGDFDAAAGALDLTADQTAAIGVYGDVDDDQQNFVLLGSQFNNTGFAISTHTSDPGIGGGEGNALEWRVQSGGVQAGRGFFNGGTQVSGADFAELFENVTQGVAIGANELVTLTGRKAEKADTGDRVHGVVATSPAYLGNAPMIPGDGDPDADDPLKWTPVALCGQVELKVDATVGVGSFIIAGATAGIGTHSAAPEAVSRRIECLEILDVWADPPGWALALCLVG